MEKKNIWAIGIIIVFPLVLLVTSYVTEPFFWGIMSIYGIVVLSKLLFQIVYSIVNRKKISTLVKKVPLSYQPSVSVVVPVYNEKKVELYNCLKSICLQEYPNSIYVVDDGSVKGNSKEVVKKIHSEFPKQKLIYHKFDQNEGKRRAQKWAFDKIKSDIIVTVDSDTILLHNAIFEITRPFYMNNIAATTGSARASNAKKNILTQLIDLRYWTAFNQERSAQGLFGAVMCCSGVFSAYRGHLIRQVKEKYIRQKFLGEYCTYGDDRHLTNLMLNKGHKVIFVPKAKSITEVPSNLFIWLKQQLRWNKSFYRETLWNIPSMRKQSLYMSYELVLQTVLPFFLFFNMIQYIYKGFILSSIYILLYITIIIAVALIRSIYGAAVTKEPVWFLFPLYAFLHIILLIPLRVLALILLGDSQWGTR